MTNMERQPDKTFFRKTDDDILDMFLAGSGKHDDDTWKLVLSEMKTRGLISRYKQTSLKMRGFETEATGPHRSSTIKAQYDAGTISEKTLLLVDDLLGAGKPGWLALKDVFELRRWLPRRVPIEIMDYETGKKVSKSRLEPRPIPGLADMALEYPKVNFNERPARRETPSSQLARRPSVKQSTT